MGALTVCILTKNEDKNIVTAVKNAMKCTSDVLIIDSGSTDRTQPLALEAGAVPRFGLGIMILQRSVILH